MWGDGGADSKASTSQEEGGEREEKQLAQVEERFILYRNVIEHFCPAKLYLHQNIHGATKLPL